ncbi:MAG: SpoIIE family protein phosphatase [Candidatus Hydrogenedentes bacterium]|nr:SpoIIE family protein phosphatase [Candidatus Hydrogenedentota bacterium]MBI3118580.1 SpoIIE family protein phosphatase [Candidatus Hydrogenedentota bacterium]
MPYVKNIVSINMHEWLEQLEQQLRERLAGAEPDKGLSRAYEALRLLGQAIESSSEGITLSDVRMPDAPLVYVNVGFEHLTGYSRAEVLGKNCRLLQGPHTDPEIVHEIGEAVREGREYCAELLNYRKDGTPFWNRLTLTPLRDAEGHVTHYVGVQSDVTSQMQANTEVRQALELLEQTNRQLTKTNQRMRQNLLAAAKVQQSLLPDRLPKLKRVRFAYQFFPCDELAGDILNVFRLDKRHVGLYLLDVTGHGTAAALQAVSVSRLLTPMTHASSLVRTHDHDEEECEDRIVSPAQVADSLNKLFPWDPETGQFFTLIYGIIDLETLEFRYVCAGHPGPAHFSVQGAPRVERGCGLPIGVADFAYEEQRIQLAAGDRLYLYSDGITDAMNASRELFGLDRLLGTLARQTAMPLEGGLQALLDALREWTGGAKFKDDLSMIAVEIAP